MNSTTPKLPRYVKVGRSVVFAVFVGLALWLMVARCGQMASERDSVTQQGVIALRAALERGDGDFAAAREAFEQGARLTLGDPYPRFCLTVLDEFETPSPVFAGGPPAGWTEAVAALRAGNLEDAERLFITVQGRGETAQLRATLYLRLIADLRAAPPGVTEVPP